MPKRVTIEDFIARSRAKHGSKFDYLRVEYTTGREKVEIICPEHGSFLQRASNHMHGIGCPACGYEDSASKQSLGQEGYICKAREVHGDKFDYSKVVYKRQTEMITIICPEHGEFEQIAESHLNGKNCAKCGGRNKTIGEFIALAMAVHGDKYDYSRVESTKTDDKVTIICPEHGPFEQRVYGHLSGKGCAECSGKAPITTREFIRRAEQVHGQGTYDYSQAAVDGVDSNVTIICQEHGAFEQTPQNHVKQESGCPACTKHGFDMSTPAILYYLRVDRFNQSPLYKIGVTNRTVAQRFRHSEDSWRITVLSEQHYGTGSEALKEEKRIITENRAYSYSGPDVLVSGGNTELFTKNILEEISETSR